MLGYIPAKTLCESEHFPQNRSELNSEEGCPMPGFPLLLNLAGGKHAPPCTAASAMRRPFEIGTSQTRVVWARCEATFPRRTCVNTSLSFDVEALRLCPSWAFGSFHSATPYGNTSMSFDVSLEVSSESILTSSQVPLSTCTLVPPIPPQNVPRHCHVTPLGDPRLPTAFQGHLVRAPAAAVILAPVAYIKVVAVKKFVVGSPNE